jgi:hypothetical protein
MAVGAVIPIITPLGALRRRCFTSSQPILTSSPGLRFSLSGSAGLGLGL